MVPRPVVAVRVGGGQDEPVQVLEEVGVGGVVLHQLLEHPGGGGGGDPLPGVDTTVDPDGWFASTFTPGGYWVRPAEIMQLIWQHCFNLAFV